MEFYTVDKANEKFDDMAKLTIVKYFIEDGTGRCRFDNHCSDDCCFLHRKEHRGIKLYTHICIITSNEERNRIAKEILEMEIKKYLSKKQISFDF